ncbi:hypothetical protein FBEOM_1948 [Fusarium beomiforme]|uniref:Uncharacterized protein n=1 Tax=Fusarium beomiforme TaxID=44412 RepID=A0A9P5ASB3_9HYPO|nr:hypothetical protein FBEOM_1948 [Fusarium beomiforme]
MVKESVPLYAFVTDLDNALLEPLEKIWTLSEFTERFDWIFTDLRVPNRAEIAQSISPQELADLGDIKGREYWYDEFYENNYALYTGPIPRWDCGERDWDKSFWHTKGSDGSIDKCLDVFILEDNNASHSVLVKLEAFR